MALSGEFVLSPETIFQILIKPISWIPDFQASLLSLLWYGSSPLLTTLKILLFLLPALNFIAGLWCTMASVYVLPFRSGRRRFIAALLISWWDSGRSAALFWGGIFRALLLTVGWSWGFLRLLVAGLYYVVLEIITLPFALFKQAMRTTLQPGIPWIAITLTILWALLEAALFSYTLYPIASEMASDMIGPGARPLLQPALFFFLFIVIAGSFACLQAMVEAIEARQWKDIVAMALFELFVMFVEVVFLYRELVDAVTPALAQQSGGQVRIGIVGVLLISAMAWIGIRSMTWFLFGRFGTPTLLAIISRRGIPETHAGRPAAAANFPWIKEVISHVKAEIGWFHDTGKELLEAYVLPPLQVLAAAVNFFMVFFTGQYLFKLPFKDLRAFVETAELLKVTRAQESGSAFRG